MSDRTVQLLAFLVANLLYLVVVIWSAIKGGFTRELLLLAACYMMLMALYLQHANVGK